MSGAWGLAINILLPIPTVLLVLLSVPLPRKYRKMLLNFSDSVLSMKFVGSYKLSHFATVVAGLLLASAAYHTHSQYSNLQNFRNGTGVQLPGTKIQLLADKWRSDRNFWIALMCFTLWLVLHRFYAMARQLVALGDENQTLKEVAARSTDAMTPTAPPPPSDPITKKLT